MPLPRGFRFSVCKHGHPFTPANTYVRPDNGRQQCRACQRARNRAYKRRKRLADRREAPQLCVDEGCPHHGTPHVCIDSSREAPPRC
jgi:hypothetical protein